MWRTVDHRRCRGQGGVVVEQSFRPRQGTARRSFRHQGSGYLITDREGASGAASCQISSPVEQPADSPLNENHHLEGPLPWTTPGIQ